MNVLKEAAKNHKIFDALYDAYKWSNRFNEKLLRVEEIRMGVCREIHYSLEEEAKELRSLLKKASKKILYLNYLTGDTLLTRQYNRDDNKDLADLISDFVETVNEVIDETEKVAL